MRNATRTFVALGAGLALLCGAGDAQAADITLGSSLASSPTSVEILTPQGFTNLAVGGSNPVVSPVDGLIAGWNERGASGGPFYLRLLIPAGGTSFTGAGTSGPATPTSTGLEHFSAELPIEAGQAIGIDTSRNRDQIGLVAAGELAEAVSPLGEGETRSFFAHSGAEIEFNAEVQPAPTIAAVGTGAGPLTGGTKVLITGADLEGASAVDFGGLGAGFEQVSETAVLATTPPGTSAGPVPLTLTTRAGTATAPEPFTYQAAATAGGNEPSGSGSSTTSSPPPPPRCMVPKLNGKKLKAAKKAIRAADCKPGKVTKKNGVTPETGRVVRQTPKPGKALAAGTKVAVKLG
jgi:hypothetical protein